MSMSDQFISEIRVFPFNFAPLGWAQCNGQHLQISQNTALYSLLGTTYGGDGMTTFGLPDLQGSVPVSAGQGHGLTERQPGEKAGSAAVALSPPEMPSHTHTLNVTSALATERQPSGQVFAQGDGISAYGPNTEATTVFYPSTISYAGNSQPHNNLMPYLTVNYCIALQGLFPQRQ